jgi:hypothetical protein
LGRLFNYTHHRSLCALVLLAAARPAIALDPRQPAASYLRHTFTTEDGLPLNVVNDVLQTRDGFLIVGSQGGVFRFDGHRFAEMNSDPPKEIVEYSLAEGPDGDLWAGRILALTPESSDDSKPLTVLMLRLQEYSPGWSPRFAPTFHPG